MRTALCGVGVEGDAALAAAVPDVAVFDGGAERKLGRAGPLMLGRAADLLAKPAPLGGTAVGLVLAGSALLGGVADAVVRNCAPTLAGFLGSGCKAGLAGFAVRKAAATLG